MFDIDEKISVLKARNMSPVVLAFLGDAVHTLYIREKLAFNSDKNVNDLHRLTSSEVKASAQAEFFDKMQGILTEEEFGIYKRARNSKKGTKAKNSTVADYNKATGFEAVLGFLYITGQIERLDEILNYNGCANEN